jgi:hypothetical protein
MGTLLMRGAMSLALLGLSLLPGCGSPNTAPSASDPRPTATSNGRADQDQRPVDAQDVLVTRDSAVAPAGCGPSEVAALVMRLFDHINRNDSGAADLVAPEMAPDGGWWSVSGGPPSSRVTAATSDEFRSYVQRRFQMEERLRLVEIAVSYRGNLADFGIKLQRTADDLPTSGDRDWNTEGKGAIDCRRMVVVVWSITTVPDSELTDPSCPRFVAKRNRVVACLTRT